MKIKKEDGITGVDIAMSVIIVTIFISLIANLIVNINLNKTETQRMSIATSYAVQEIEKIKANGYIEEKYDEKGITNEEILNQIYGEDILDSNGEFTGFNKKIFIKDYKLIDNTKQKNLLKQITVEISYKISGKDKNVTISTYIAKE